MAERAPPLMVVRDVSARRGGRTVVTGVSLTVAPHDLYLLRGANGSGKTTLLRTLARLSPPALGALEGGDDTTAYLGHSDGVKAALTVRENLQFWAALYRADNPATKSAAGRLRLASLLDRRAASLSAGQQRRLALARVAISGRPLWLLDEPTAGMDAASVAAALDLIKDHCRTGGAALVATHEALALPDAVSITLSPKEAAA